MFAKINDFNSYVDQLLKAGMTMGAENDEGIFSLCTFFTDEIGWHTEQIDTDPWEWRMRVLEERKDISYGKLFFKKSGYITQEWFPYFYAVRRGNTTLEEEYEDGKISQFAKRIYSIIEEHKEYPLHLIKEEGGFAKDEKSAFDRAITELQMKLYLSMCARTRKISKNGETYGWNATVFCLTDEFFPEETYEKAFRLKADEAYDKLYDHILEINPDANPKKIKKFILG